MNATSTVDPTVIASIMLSTAAVLAVYYTYATGETSWLEKLIYLLIAYGIILLSLAYGLQPPQITISL